MSSHTRREFTKLALAALPGAALLSTMSRLGAAEAPAKPDSKVAGVQIGLNVPYSFANALMSGDDILKNCVQLGLSAVELRTQPVEAFLGLPMVEAAKDRAEIAQQTREWRKTVSLDPVKEFRAKYETAGVLIQIVKVDGIFKMSDEEIDYAFALAKALGGRAISTEISHKAEDLKRLGQFADKHEFMVGYHGHATTKPEDWEEALCAREIQRRECGSRAFCGGQQHFAGPVSHAASRAGDACACEGPEVQQRTEHAFWRGRHADRGSAAPDPRQQVEHAGDDRV